MVFFANDIKNIDFTPLSLEKLLVRPIFDYITLVYLQTDGTLMRLSSEYTGQPKAGKKAS